MSVSQMKFQAKFRLRKRNFKSNFNDMGTIGASKYRRKLEFIFFEILTMSYRVKN